MKTKKLVTGILFSLLSTTVLAQVVDRDSDGFIEINSLDDLNEIRSDPSGRTFRGSSEGCPDTGCFGFELTRDLDFDTNKNGYLDAGDWNGGKPWKSLELSGSIQGNGHSISNVLITTPVIKNSGGQVKYNYGFFDFLVEYTLSINLRFISPKIIVDGSTIPANALVNIGVFEGERAYPRLIDVDVENATISYTRPASLPPLGGGNIGGLIGSAVVPDISGVSFDGTIQVSDLVPHNVGGLVGTAYDGSISLVKVTGNIYGGGHMGGIAGSVMSTDISSVYSNVNISSSGDKLSGGVVGKLHIGEDKSLAGLYSVGKIQKGGGFIGVLDAGNFTLSLNGYSRSVVDDSGKSYAQLIGQKTATVKINNNGAYQIIDPEGIVLTSQPNAYTNGVSQAQTVWPNIKLPQRFPWSSTDNPDASGDYEGISRLKNHVPQYTCETPTGFEVKEKKSGYTFSVYSHNEVFDTFNAKQGLKCSDAKQIDGRCENYEVSYLCGGSGVIPGWTDWLSQDNASNDTGDSEPIPAGVCSQGEPVGIRARPADTLRWPIFGSPQIPKKFALSKGFECVHEGNGPKGKANCKDYEVRMFCEY